MLLIDILNNIFYLLLKIYICNTKSPSCIQLQSEYTTSGNGQIIILLSILHKSGVLRTRPINRLIRYPLLITLQPLSSEISGISKYNFIFKKPGPTSGFAGLFSKNASGFRAGPKPGTALINKSLLTLS